MRELNTEQIIKGLEHCCLNGEGCYECPYDDVLSCREKLCADALALIKEFEETQVDAAKIFEEFEALVAQKDMPITTMALLATKEYADFKKKWAKL